MTARQILTSAQLFFWAAERSMEERRYPEGGYQILFQPALVSWAFSAEVAIKSLLTAQGKRKEDFETHNLYKLFTKLHGSTQNKIRELLFQRSASHPEIPADPEEFKKNLKIFGNAFEENRYLYEKQQSVIFLKFVFLKEFSRSVIDIGETLIPKVDISEVVMYASI